MEQTTEEIKETETVKNNEQQENKEEAQEIKENQQEPEGEAKNESPEEAKQVENQVINNPITVEQNGSGAINEVSQEINHNGNDDNMKEIIERNEKQSNKDTEPGRCQRCNIF